MLSDRIVINNKIKNFIIFTLLFFAVITLLRLYFKPFFIIGFLYVIIKPIYNFFIKPSSSYKRLYTAMLIIIMNIVFFMIIFYMGSYIYNLANKILQLEIFSSYDYLENILEIINKNSQDLIKGILGEYSSVIKQGAITTGDGVLAYIIANISIYFLLVDGELFKSIIKKVLPEKIHYSIIKNYNVFKKYFAIEIILVLISTFLTMIGFLTLQVRDGVSLAVLCGVLDLVPYVGTIIVFIPLIIYNIIMKKYFVAIALLFIYIIVQIVREVLEAKYISNSFSLHPLAVLISIYMGVKFFGVLGVIAGPIFCLFSRDIVME